ncbi:endo-1,3-beta-glucanase Engl1 [Terfezia claveryi]|nr:endo-1,3-beta-glucanase Engl1 [Terfezia claveryi]
MASTQLELFSSPISVDAPPALFHRRDGHPIQPKGVSNSSSAGPIQTNKFYSNLYLGSQGQAVWTLPYVVWVDKNPLSWGLSISHTEARQLAFGPGGADPPRFFISPLGIKSLAFSATEFNAGSTINTAQHQDYSVELSLYANHGTFGAETKKITSNLVLGMGFVTARYYDLVPVLNSGVMFLQLEKGVSPRPGVDKWKATLEDRTVWFIYLCPEGRPSVNLKLESNSRVVGDFSFTGYIQITKAPNAAAEPTIDSTAGAFPLTTILTANYSIQNNVASYQLTHIKHGSNNAGALLMYALPHHITSFEAVTAQGVAPGIKLQTPTKGNATAVVANQWRFTEAGLPSEYATWLPNDGFGLSDPAIRSVIDAALRKEIRQDFVNGSNLDSMYFAGKARDKELTRTSLERLKAAVDRFATNKQKYGLVYETTWKGIISDAMFKTGDQMTDFGNGNYNDHHFHYGYHIYAAAVIGHIEMVLNGRLDWAERNKAWVNTMIRDVANPSDKDPYFPVSRCFDWWHGHSWAKGVFESGDGKDQESTSEDYNYAYAQRLWGLITGDRAMEGRALLMLSIMKRSFNTYFLLDDKNTVQPQPFIRNKVTGILFENKVDHTTYFGLKEEYIHGIHMLPITPVSPYIRQSAFCRQEWMSTFDKKTGSIDSGWKGVLYANVALFEPKESWKFFAQSGFQDKWLDDGATRTWYLVMAAGRSYF